MSKKIKRPTPILVPGKPGGRPPKPSKPDPKPEAEPDPKPKKLQPKGKPGDN